jgi:hypothetical protein
MTSSQIDPQKEDAINTPGPSRPTMTATDRRERGMSPDEQPLHNDANSGARTNRRVILAAGIVTLLAAGGITVIEAGRSTAPHPKTSASHSPSTSATAPTPEDLAVVAAEGRYRQFLQVVDTIGLAGFRDAAALRTVAVPPERTVQLLAVRQSNGLRQQGRTRLSSLEVSSVVLNPATGDYPSVVLQACLDVSGVDVVDRSGHSVVTRDRAKRSRSTVTMYKYAKGTTGAEVGGWFVYQATARNEPC